MLCVGFRCKLPMSMHGLEPADDRWRRGCEPIKAPQQHYRSILDSTIASHGSITGAALRRHRFNGSSVGLPLLAWRVGPVGCPGSELAEASGPRPGWGFFFAPIRCMWSGPWPEQLIDGAKTDEECHSEPSGAWRRSFSRGYYIVQRSRMAVSSPACQCSVSAV